MYVVSIIYEYRSGGIYLHHSLDNCPDPEAFQMHTHDTAEILCFISGKGKYFVEGNYYQLTPGCILIMRSNESHQLHIERTAPYERIALRFPETLLLGIDPERYLLRPFTLRPLGTANRYTPEDTGIDFVRYMLSMIPETGSGEYIRRLAITGVLPGLLYELERYFSKNVTAVPDDKPKEMVASVIEYINSHLFDDFTLDTLSESFYISKSYLNRRFKEATGSTLWNYVLIKRLMVAREEIRSGQPATKVFASCGFKDYSGFYRQYRLHFGVSPKDDKLNDM